MNQFTHIHTHTHSQIPTHTYTSPHTLLLTADGDVVTISYDYFISGECYYIILLIYYENGQTYIFVFKYIYIGKHLTHYLADILEVFHQ